MKCLLLLRFVVVILGTGQLMVQCLALVMACGERILAAFLAAVGAMVEVEVGAIVEMGNQDTAVEAGVRSLHQLPADVPLVIASFLRRVYVEIVVALRAIVGLL
ncbi:MAG: hypothetical protein ABIR47_04615 [Candidatus Kapaibacterium sp.]